MTNTDKVREILAKLWNTVDLEDVEEQLIDVGAIDDAEQALNHHYAKEFLEIVRTNQKGSFEDDAGNICWYLDDLEKTINKRYLEGEE